jgi:hypothetical protein
MLRVPLSGAEGRGWGVCASLFILTIRATMRLRSPLSCFAFGGSGVGDGVDGLPSKETSLSSSSGAKPDESRERSGGRSNAAYACPSAIPRWSIVRLEKVFIIDACGRFEAYTDQAIHIYTGRKVSVFFLCQSVSAMLIQLVGKAQVKREEKQADDAVDEKNIMRAVFFDVSQRV